MRSGGPDSKGIDMLQLRDGTLREETETRDTPQVMQDDERRREDGHRQI